MMGESTRSLNIHPLQPQITFNIHVLEAVWSVYREWFQRPGREVMKLFRCSTQLRFKFILLINVGDLDL